MQQLKPQLRFGVSARLKPRPDTKPPLNAQDVPVISEQARGDFRPIWLLWRQIRR